MGQQAQRVSGWPSGIYLYGLVATLFSVTEAGLLKVGRPLPWRTSLPALKHVRKAGVRQFLHIYHRLKDITQDELLWGDELEYGIFKVDRQRKKAWLSLRGKEVMERLMVKEDEYSDMLDGCSWHPEWGAWMIESTPNRPYTGYATDLLRVEANMRLRRKRLLTVLEPDEVSPTLTNFPLMGCGAFTVPEAEAGGPVSESKYVPDLIINPHPRFAALVANIRSRRGRKVDIRVPLFRDCNTPEFRGLHDDTEHDGALRGALRHAEEQRPYIDMDAMAFGMGCCCMQVTFQARDIDESRYMYDQLAVLSPIMMALTAASPIFKGRLADTDVRWDTIAASVDDRTPAERGELGDDKKALENAAVDELAGRGVRRLYKSRYDSISTYIYECDRSGRGNSINRYNDIPCEIDEEILTQLREGGVDDTLAKHVAHLFVRDPLVIFDDSIDVDDSKTTEHFENIQSTNWQTVRWKPPPVRNSNEDPHIGWRTEFRSMEIQLTDFENGAFTVFVVLLTRIILAFDLSLYIPLSKVDENMRRAHKRDGALKEKFFFRKHLAPQQTTTAAAAAGAVPASTSSEACCDHHTHAPLDGAEAGGAEASYSVCSACAGDDDYEEMTIAEILNGKGEYFPGLIPLAYMYLDYIGCDRETFSKVSSYLEYIRKRGTGETLTTAAWIRKYVTSHPDYAHNSVVSPSIAFDLVMKCKRIGEGKEQCPDLLGTVSIDPIFATEAYPATLSSDKLHISERARLFRAYKNRSPFHKKLVSQQRVPDFFHS